MNKYFFFHIKNSTKQGFQFSFLKIVLIFKLNVFSKRDNIENKNYLKKKLEKYFKTKRRYNLYNFLTTCFHLK